MRLAYAPYYLHFKEPAGTSRGVLTTKLTCFLKVWDENNPDVFGIGEAAVFEGLSKEAGPRYEYKVIETLANVALGKATDLTDFPSIQCGLEQALHDFASGCKGIYFPSSFTEGNEEIQINGLVWMGDIDTMMARLHKKMEEGFRCIKLKIGAINFADELKMLDAIRSHYGPDRLQIRVDANGGFNMDNVIAALHALSKYDVHSIEQPIAAGTWDLMAFLGTLSPVPIALDEELIGVNTTEAKRDLLDTIKPAYIILKPSLCGGFSGAEEWIALAKERNIGWWVTSALESNVGLSAIAQWTATLGVDMPQGLGTGALFTNNFSSPLVLEKDMLRCDPAAFPIDRKQFDRLQWRE